MTTKPDSSLRAALGKFMIETAKLFFVCTILVERAPMTVGETMLTFVVVSLAVGVIESMFSATAKWIRGVWRRRSAPEIHIHLTVPPMFPGGLATRPMRPMGSNPDLDHFMETLRNTPFSAPPPRSK